MGKRSAFLATPAGRALLGSASVLALLMAAPAASQDTCDVVVTLDAAGPFGSFGWAIDYAGSGAEFIGDSTLPGFGPSWGSQRLACTPLVAVSEYTAIDDNAGLVSHFVFDIGLGLGGPAPLVTCIVSLPGGFPCPAPTDFSIVDAVFPNDPFPPPPVPSPPALSVTVTPRIPVCGDGFAEGTEECDDGNVLDGDCCSASCLLDLAGTPCPDASVCTSGETCDGAGTCVVGSTLACDDGVACTHDFCDDVSGCQSAPEPTPLHSCDHVYDGRVDLLDRATSDRADRLRVNVLLADGPLGDPTATTDYAVCLFDASGGVYSNPVRLELPAGAPWKTSRGGFSYLDKTASTDGIRRAQLRQLGSGQVRLRVTGKGASLPLPGPSGPGAYFDGDPETVVQVENSDGACWTEALAAPIRNETERFKAKVD